MTSLNMAPVLWEGGYRFIETRNCCLQCLAPKKNSRHASILFISTRDAHAEQSNTSMSAVDSTEKIHWVPLLIRSPGLCPGISFPPSGGETAGRHQCDWLTAVTKREHFD